MREAADAPKRDTPGVIAPPPLIFGGIFLLALAIDRTLLGMGFSLPDEARTIAGGLCGFAGIALILVAAVQFRAARTAIEPWKPTTAIVTTGVFGFSRNPIYLGMAVGYAGLGLLADSVLALVLLPLALLIMQYGVIRREERYLETKFGNSYSDYCRNVRRWM